jgi:hypothetical protein
LQNTQLFVEIPHLRRLQQRGKGEGGVTLTPGCSATQEVYKLFEQLGEVERAAHATRHVYTTLNKKFFELPKWVQEVVKKMGRECDRDGSLPVASAHVGHFHHGM